MVYKWYILPIGWLYITYHLLGEPETTIETLLNWLKYSALNVDITLVGSCICLWDTLKLTSNNYILHCFCIFCAVPHCHPLSPHWERSPGLPDRIWKTTMRFVGKSSYMTWWMIKERGNQVDSPIQTILEMKLVELLNEIIFLATFNKQSNRVLEKCNNTFLKKNIKLQPNQFAF